MAMLNNQRVTSHFSSLKSTFFVGSHGMFLGNGGNMSRCAVVRLSKLIVRNSRQWRGI